MTEALTRVLGATDAAAAGPEHVTEPVAYDAILLAGFGGPEGQDDVIPFLRNVTRGRGIPEERLEEVAHHYRHFGGVSPINDQNRELKAALEAELASRSIDLPVLWGNRNWAPYLRDALNEANDAATAAYLGRSDACDRVMAAFARQAPSITAAVSATTSPTRSTLRAPTLSVHAPATRVATMPSSPANAHTPMRSDE